MLTTQWNVSIAYGNKYFSVVMSSPLAYLSPFLLVTSCCNPLKGGALKTSSLHLGGCCQFCSYMRAVGPVHWPLSFHIAASIIDASYLHRWVTFFGSPVCRSQDCLRKVVSSDFQIVVPFSGKSSFTVRMNMVGKDKSKNWTQYDLTEVACERHDTGFLPICALFQDSDNVFTPSQVRSWSLK